MKAKTFIFSTKTYIK